jgi:hypothetical protein
VWDNQFSNVIIIVLNALITFNVHLPKIAHPLPCAE